MELLQTVNAVLSLLFFLCCAYQIVYAAASLFGRRIKPPPAKPRRYGVLIAARNEEAVIGDLIDSIRRARYPAGLIDIFVCADNCTDATAAVARFHGAQVFLRHNKREVGKGYALDHLLRCIKERGCFDRYDGFFVFDADNTVDPDYFAEMNGVFSPENRVVMSYRSGKNFDDNWISAAYSLWFIRDARLMNDGRMRLHTSSVVGGTGFLAAREILEDLDGWPFHMLTEDTEFTAEMMLRGEFIAYCRDAVFYDEQPTSFRQSWQQRLRWTKGFMQVLLLKGGSLLRCMVHKKRFACFDLLMAMAPAVLFPLIGLLVGTAAAAAALLNGEDLLPILLAAGKSFLMMYGVLLLTGLVTLAAEWKRIRGHALRKVAFLFTFPLFMMTYLPVTLAACFCRVEWTPIRHGAAARQGRRKMFHVEQ